MLHHPKVPFLSLKEVNLSFGSALSDAVQSTLDSGWYLNGQRLQTFEKAFADYIGTTYCIGVGNGLDALTLSLMALKWKHGWDDEAEVIVPAMTFVATGQAVVRAGLKLKLADVDSHGVVNAATISKAITPHTRAILPVHLYGQMAPMRELVELAERYGLTVLEDAAQAHGAAAEGTKAGAWGEMSAFSFYPGKNLGALGDAGAVCTNDETLARRVRMLANYGAERKYHHESLGMNSRMDEIQAAVLGVKLSRLDADNGRRRHIASIYDSTISHPLVQLPHAGCGTDMVHHIYAIRCKRRDALQNHLEQAGIQTLIHYPFTLAEQPALAPHADLSHASSRWPEATRWAREELSLPISPVMSEADARLVAETVNTFHEP